jgi:hypothetical protein
MQQRVHYLFSLPPGTRRTQRNQTDPDRNVLSQGATVARPCTGGHDTAVDPLFEDRMMPGATPVSRSSTGRTRR